MTPERSPDDAPEGDVEPYLSAVAVALSDARRRAVLARLAADGPTPLEVLASDLAAAESDADTEGVLHELEVEHVPVLAGIGLASFDPERRVLESTATTHTLVACADDMHGGLPTGDGDDESTPG